MKRILASRPPLERMMQIHQAIQSGHFPNAPQLAARLEVSTKSIHRDLEFMRDRLNLPVEFSREKNGYNYTEEVSAFPTLQITEGELLALVIAEKALQQYRGTTFEKPLLSAFKKMVASLPDTISFHLKDWDQAISFRTRAEPLVNMEIFDALAQATAERKELRLTYRKPGRRDPEARTVHPYHLGNINGEWFLFAYDLARNDIRTFVPARIQAAEPTGKDFERPLQFSLEKRLRDSFGVHAGKGQHIVVIRFDAPVADYIREKKWHVSQTLRELKDGRVELTLNLSSLDEIKRWILSWGENARVIRPPELVKIIQKAARQISERY